jgi:mono-ADP-ribosyltransferase sirtuin 6
MPGDGSLGYADRLSYREELGGTLGEPEVAEAAAKVEAKASKLAQLIRESQHLVVFTGAGISTSCGIPGGWVPQRSTYSPAHHPVCSQ